MGALCGTATEVQGHEGVAALWPSTTQWVCSRTAASSTRARRPSSAAKAAARTCKRSRDPLTLREQAGMKKGWKEKCGKAGSFKHCEPAGPDQTFQKSAIQKKIP
jgi:hypothetical protein